MNFNRMKAVDEERNGWSIECPNCQKQARYTVLNLNMAHAVEPFMYCDSCSDFILRDEDAERIQEPTGGQGVTSEYLRTFYSRLELESPMCRCGGRFRVWANVKCPHCQWEFPYNNGVRSEEVRYFETKIIWMEGATAHRGERQPSNKLAKVNV